MLRSFVAAPRQTGTLAPSSRMLARRLADLAFAPGPRVVVEIGAGSGAVTRELERRARAHGARFLAVELERGLARRVRARGGPAVQAHAAWLPVARADVVVSGIPFASLRRTQASAILAEAARVAPRLVLFQYTGRRLDLIAEHFPVVREHGRVAWNLPPARTLVATTG